MNLKRFSIRKSKRNATFSEQIFRKNHKISKSAQDFAQQFSRKYISYIIRLAYILQFFTEGGGCSTEMIMSLYYLIFYPPPSFDLSPFSRISFVRHFLY